MNQISAGELKEWKEKAVEFTLIDVRESYEREEFNIGGLHIPLNELMQNISSIPANKLTVIYCAKGIRSAIAIQRLEALGYQNLYNLAGGIYALRQLNR